jgi:hypothetical protein
MCLHQNTIIYHGFAAPTPGGGVKRKPHQDPEVQAGYMQALDKLVPDDEECDTIQRQLSHYISGNGAFGTNHAIRDRGNLSSLEWWNMHGGVAPQLQRLATWVLSQVVNTSSAREVLEHLQFHPQCQKKQVECKLVRELGLCALQLAIVVPLL